MRNISIRLPEKILKLGDLLAKYEYADRSMILRKALLRGIADLRIDEAVMLYSEGRLSISEASDLAGLSVGEMLDVLSDRGVKKEISSDDVLDSLRNAMGVIE